MASGRSLKLQLIPLWPALAAILVATALAWTLLPRLIEQGSAEQLQSLQPLIAPTVAEHIDPSTEELQPWVEELAGGGSLRLTVIAGDGTVLADSSRTLEQLAEMDNHRSRPEVREALATGSGVSTRESATTGRQYAYAARTVTGLDGRLYVVRLAQPLEELAGLRRRLAAAMALAAGAALLVVLIISFWLSKRLFRPLGQLVDGAGELAAGRYGHRLVPPSDPHLSALAHSLNRLAGRIEQQFTEVEGERDHLQAIVHSMSDGVLVTDGSGRARLTNPAFRRLFALETDPLNQRPLEITRHRQLARLVDSTLEKGLGQTDEVEIRHPERRTVTLTSAALAAGPAAVEGAVVVARDTTQFTRVNEMRRDFVANVSHELKTPLAAIRGYAETLRDGALDDRETADRFIRRILDQCQRLQGLLDDLLVLSRLETLGVENPPQTLELYPLAQRAVEVVGALADAREVEVRIEGEPLPSIEGNPESLERLFVNLIDNAVKYNRPGGEVVVRLGRGAQGWVRIEVTDTGIGIPPESIARIFERFYRVDKGRSRAEGGTGLGLAIVKHIVQSHGGSIDVESVSGQGTTFRILLPRQRPGAGEPPSLA